VTFARASDGKEIPTRWVGEQHVEEDLGFVPTAADWLRELRPQTWMTRSRKLSKELEAIELPTEEQAASEPARTAPAASPAPPAA